MLNQFCWVIIVSAFCLSFTDVSTTGSRNGSCIFKLKIRCSQTLASICSHGFIQNKLAHFKKIIGFNHPEKKKERDPLKETKFLISVDSKRPFRCKTGIGYDGTVSCKSKHSHGSFTPKGTRINMT